MAYDAAGLRLRLNMLCQSARFAELDRLDSYAENRQYETRAYDFDGRFRAYGTAVAVLPGFPVLYSQRKPSTTHQLAKIIVQRLSAMVFSSERWPQVVCEEDADTQDYVRTLAEEAELPARMLELRNFGGQCGTAVCSFALLDGKPRVHVHHAKHIFVLRWADRDAFVVGAALKIYRYRKTIVVAGNTKEVWFYFARYWDEEMEVAWDPIPEEEAHSGMWASTVKSYQVEHGYGECPVYWAQNITDPEHEDGHSDFDGELDTIDTVNLLLSAAPRGTLANVDPTLVIKDEQTKNTGVVRKGSGHAIWSKGGAEYLELSGDGIRVAFEQAQQLSQNTLDTCSVVLADPKTLASKAQSGAALKMLYMPMTTACDKLRTQYGAMLVRLLKGMLRACRMALSTPPGAVFVTADGRRFQAHPVVLLPDRVVAESKDGVTTTTRMKRVPGTGESLKLSWPGYFQATGEEVKLDVDAAVAARGKLISQETAVRAVAHHYGVTDPAKELKLITEQAEAEMELQASLYPMPSDSGGGGGDNADE